MAVVTFKPTDAFSVMNSLVRQATGQKDIVVTDTTSFISAGQKVLESGMENVYNSLSVLIGRTIIASRPYTGKFRLIASETSDAFENRVRKISIYARDNQASGMYNTDLYTNIQTGLSDVDGAGSQWEQNLPLMVEENYFSSFVWDKCHTRVPEQDKIAFTNETTFIDFVNGIMVEVQNDIESTLEAKNRMVCIDRLAGQYLMVDRGNIGKESAVNMTTYFNNEFGTNYKTKEILSEHLDNFLETWVAKFKIDSDFIENRSALYHDAMAKTIDGVDYHVLRHTPKEYQRFIYFAPFFTKAKTRVFPEIFNPQYLNMEQGEGIDYWQSVKNPSAIKVKPALPDGEESENVELDLVLGLLYDRDAIMVNNRFTGMYSTGINARHVFENLWWHYNFGVINSYSENAILYYMNDEDVKPDEKSESFTGDGTETDFVLTGDVAEIVSVTVDGVAVSSDDYSFDAETKTISFDTAPTDEAVIVVTYI